MASEEDVPSAEEVSDAFVKQYFQVLENMPEQARRLYVDGSVVSRPGLDGKMLSFTSVEDINEQFLSSDYRNATFEVTRVDSQNSVEKGVFIQVIGFFTGKDKLRRKFSQSFYLARRDRVYVVINDILHYVDDVPSSPVSPLVTESVPVNEVVEAVDEPSQPETVSKIDTSLENSENVAEATPPLDNGEIEHSNEKADTVEKTTEPVAETIAQKPMPNPTKRSFADIVQSMAQSSAPFQVRTAPVRAKSTGQPRAASAPQPSASVANSEKRNDQNILEEPGTSIFVANLPMSAVPAQLHELFKKFGPIKENGIQVRSSRISGICFGFVAFESSSSVQSVLQAAKASPFTLGDRKLRIKEKQVDYDKSKPSGRNGSGNRTQNSSGDSDDSKRRDNAGRNRSYGGRNGHERRGDRHADGDVNPHKANSDSGQGSSAVAPKPQV